LNFRSIGHFLPSEKQLFVLNKEMFLKYFVFIFLSLIDVNHGIEVFHKPPKDQPYQYKTVWYDQKVSWHSFMLMITRMRCDRSPFLSLDMYIQLHICLTTTTLMIHEEWQLLTGGRCSEVIYVTKVPTRTSKWCWLKTVGRLLRFYYKHWNQD
jgi:hypothetical protein